ncbi:MAG: hypothetical protein ACI8WT_003131 [Clostridium sp.]
MPEEIENTIFKNLIKNNLGVFITAGIAVVTANLYFIGILFHRKSEIKPLNFWVASPVEFYIYNGFMFFLIVSMLLFSVSIIRILLYKKFLLIDKIFMGFLLLQSIIILGIGKLSSYVQNDISKNTMIYEVKSIKLKNQKNQKNYNNTNLIDKTDKFIILVDINNSNRFHYINKTEIESMEILKQDEKLW